MSDVISGTYTTQYLATNDVPVLPDITACGSAWWESRHSKGSLWAFADGHVKYLAFTQVMGATQCSTCLAAGQLTYFMAQQQ